MYLKFSGKTIIITRGGSDVGRITALKLAEYGAHVVVVDSNVESGNETLRLIQECFGQGLFVHADISNSKDVENLINKVLEVYGEINGLVNIVDTEDVKVSLLNFSVESGGCIVNVSNDNGVIELTKRAVTEYSSENNIRFNVVSSDISNCENLDDIANVTSFLLSDEGKGINGGILEVCNN